MRKLLAGLGLAAALAAPAVHAQTIAFASLPPGTLLNSQTQAMAKAIQDNSDLKVRVVTFSGDIHAYDALSTGQAEFFIDAIHVTLEAIRGLGVFEGRPRSNVQVAQRLFPFYTSIMVRKDSPITTIEQLRGTADDRQVTVRAETALAAFTTPSSGGWLMLGKHPS